jgi:hypothetical protein
VAHHRLRLALGPSIRRRLQPALPSLRRQEDGRGGLQHRRSSGDPSIGDGPDAAGSDATSNLVISSNGEGALSVIDAKAVGYPSLEELPTQKGVPTLAYDAATVRISLVAAEFGPLPAPAATVPHPRPRGIPDTFTALVVGR